MAHGIKRAVIAARDKVTEEIDATSRGRDGMYARGLAGEGYAGGYRDALADVLLALNGVQPSTRGYWRRAT